MRKYYAKLRYDAEGTWYRSRIVDAETLDGEGQMLKPNGLFCWTARTRSSEDLCILRTVNKLYILLALIILTVDGSCRADLSRLAVDARLYGLHITSDIILREGANAAEIGGRSAVGRAGSDVCAIQRRVCRRQACCCAARGHGKLPRDQARRERKNGRNGGSDDGEVGSGLHLGVLYLSRDG